MHTKDFLAQELRKAGLNDIADKAALGYYHDYLSPLTFPEMQLMNDLGEKLEATTDPILRSMIKTLMHRHMNGEFDANLKESDEWAASPEGQETLNMLVKGFKDG